MTLLTKQAILSALDIKHEDVEVPEWGGTVRVRTMSGLERDAMGAAMIGADGKPDMATYRVRMAAATIVGEDDLALFTADDVQSLGARSAAALDRVFDAADRLNKVGGVEAAVKN